MYSDSTNLASGSPNVYANNLPIGRIGDLIVVGIKVNAGLTKRDSKQLEHNGTNNITQRRPAIIPRF